jgi:geranylgeranyl pyrophosphate synthase
LEKLFPRGFNSTKELNAYINRKNISPSLSFEDPEVYKSVSDGINRVGYSIIDRGGKLWRPVFGLMINNILAKDIKIKEDTMMQLIYMAEIFHNASLIIDDIEDQSEMRRNKPCAHHLFGEDICINAGSSMFFLPFLHIVNNVRDDLDNNKEKSDVLQNIVKSYLQEMTAYHLGQNLDIEMKGHRVPEIETYNDIVLCKTGVMIRLITKWMYNISNHQKIQVNVEKYKQYDLLNYLLKLADHLAIAFQIKDDLMNIKPSSVSKSKGMVGEDIYEGKQSLMVLHGIKQTGKSQVKANRLMEIVNLRTKDETLIAEAIGIMDELGSVSYAEEKMKENYIQCIDLCDNLRHFVPNKEGVSDLNDLVAYLIERH